MSQEVELRERIEKAVKIYKMMYSRFIRKQEISRETKIKVFKSVFRPILTFGSESWVLNEKQKSMIQAVEMKFMRRVLGVTKRDRIKNEDIREQLGVQSILKYIEGRQLSWWGHLQRMEDSRPVKRIWESRIEKNRKRGRPRQTWDQAISKILERKGTTWSEAKRRASDKKDWKKFCKE